MARSQRKSSGIICTARRPQVPSRIDVACHTDARSSSMALPNAENPQFGPGDLVRHFRPCLLAGVFLDSNFPWERPSGIGLAGNCTDRTYVRSIDDGRSTSPTTYQDRTSLPSPSRVMAQLHPGATASWRNCILAQLHPGATLRLAHRSAIGYGTTNSTMGDLGCSSRARLATIAFCSNSSPTHWYRTSRWRGM